MAPPIPGIKTPMLPLHLQLQRANCHSESISLRFLCWRDVLRQAETNRLDRNWEVIMSWPGFVSHSTIIWKLSLQKLLSYIPSHGNYDGNIFYSSHDLNTSFRDCMKMTVVGWTLCFTKQKQKKARTSACVCIQHYWQRCGLHPGINKYEQTAKTNQIWEGLQAKWRIMTVMSLSVISVTHGVCVCCQTN